MVNFIKATVLSTNDYFTEIRLLIDYGKHFGNMNLRAQCPFHLTCFFHYYISLKKKHTYWQRIIYRIFQCKKKKQETILLFNTNNQNVQFMPLWKIRLMEHCYWCRQVIWYNVKWGKNYITYIVPCQRCYLNWINRQILEIML